VFFFCLSSKAKEKMDSDGLPPQPTVEQSWIVLDDNGWMISATSRPPTASPSRRSPRLEDDGDEEEELRTAHRIGMDRDVREALEMAERSLELAGSTDEFTFRKSQRVQSDDDLSTQRSSPVSRMGLGYGGFPEDTVEGKYNGRAAPTVGGNRRGFIISTDSEHVAFQNIKAPSRGDTPVPSLLAQPVSKDPTRSAIESSSGLSSSRSYENHARPHSAVSNNQSSRPIGEDEEHTGSLIKWMLAISGSPNFVPLALSHVVTLLIGFYLGGRRAGSLTTNTVNTSGLNNGSGVGVQCPST
jgi:hypothetical protein